MYPNKLLTVLKLQTDRQKKGGETIKEASGYVRLERVNKWPNCMLAK
jgi:hypothetical protein